MNKIRKLVMALCVIGILSLMFPMVAWADDGTVTLDLGNGAIDITPTGYRQGNGEEVAFTGSYVITGSLTADTPLDIENNSGSLFTCNITLDNASIIGATWCTAVRISGNSEIALSITNVGNSVIKGYNHAAIVTNSSANAYVSISSPKGNNLYMGSAESSTSEKVYRGSMSLTINGVVPDNDSNLDLANHTCSYKTVWWPEIYEMSLDDFIENTNDIEPKGACVCGNVTEAADITDKIYTNPTCTETGEGYYKSVIDGVEYESPHYVLYKLPHQIVDVPAVSATCETDGSIEYWTCTQCGAKYADEAGTIEITDEDIDVAATGHSYKEEWSFDKENHWRECTVCGGVTDKAEHAWGSWTVTAKATHIEDGSRERTCSECGYKMTEVIPALKDINDPTTETEQTTEVTTESSTEITTEPETEVTTEKATESTTAEITTESKSTTESVTEGTTNSTNEEKKNAPNTGDPEKVSLYIIVMGLSLAGVIMIIGKKKKYL